MKHQLECKRCGFLTFNLQDFKDHMASEKAKSLVNTIYEELE